MWPYFNIKDKMPISTSFRTWPFRIVSQFRLCLPSFCYTVYSRRIQKSLMLLLTSRHFWLSFSGFPNYREILLATQAICELDHWSIHQGHPERFTWVNERWNDGYIDEIMSLICLFQTWNTFTWVWITW